MDNFKIWILSLCGATAITSLFKILLSGSSLNKVLNVFFSIFILFYTVIPLQSFINDYSYKSKFDEEKIDYNEFYKDGFEEVIKSSVENVCADMKIQVQSFDISSYINDDGYLCVKQLVIDIDNNERIDEVKTELKKQLGYEVNVQ